MSLTLTEEIELRRKNDELKRRQAIEEPMPKEVAFAMEKLQKVLKPSPSKEAAREIERNKAEQARREQLQATIQKHWQAPERHARRSDLSGPKEWHQTLAMVKQRLGTGFLIALVGDRGPGKTQLAVEVMKHACIGLIASRYALAMDIFIDIKSTYRRDASRSERDVIDEYCSKPLLVIDECQERGETDWESRMLRYIVDCRYQAVKDTLMICNGSAIDFAKNVGDSILSRCNESGGVKECKWPSFRG